MHNPTPLRRFGRCTAIALAGVLSLAGSGCSIGTIVARTTVSVLDGGVDAMNRETDLELAKSAIPPLLTRELDSSEFAGVVEDIDATSLADIEEALSRMKRFVSKYKR